LLIILISSWNDRIPFVLLFSIATSIELFQSKLSRETVRRLSGTEFHVEGVDTEKIFRDIHYQEPVLFFGPTISNLMLRQHLDFIQSSAAFAQTLKVILRFNCLDRLLTKAAVLVRIHDALLCKSSERSALRKPCSCSITEGTLRSDSQPSFLSDVSRPILIQPWDLLQLTSDRFAQTMIDEQDYEAVRDMLDDDESLNETVMRELMNGRKAIQDILSALKILCKLESYTTSKTNAPWSELYIPAMSGSLLDSQIFNDIVCSIKKLPSDAMEDLVTSSIRNAALSPDLTNALASVKTDLAKLIASLPNPEMALRSAYDIHHSTLRTTVVAQKVSLSKNSSKLSSQDTAYTNIVDRVYDAITDHMRRTLIDPQKQFLNEILVYDFKSPHREVFMPHPRFAIERALSSPHDYLGCECCSSDKERGLEASQPATTILYQLYLESGSVINTADLWEAFWTIVGGEAEEDEERERERALALFSRALAELKYLGMIKNSRKKADHIAKLTWQGL